MLSVETEFMSSTGGISFNGMVELLGPTRLPKLEIVVREALQNSWDARTGKSIDFGIKVFRFDDDRLRQVREVMGTGLERNDGRAPLLQLPSKDLEGIVLWDRGTKGLEGPVHLRELGEGEPDAFCRFFYLIGETKPSTGQQAQGGTYGFGRFSFLLASTIHTIFVYTVRTINGALDRRFLGKTLTVPERVGGRRTTGRHWWGRPRGGRDSDVSAASGDDAETLAGIFGLDVLGDGQCGTAILILAPKWVSDGEGADQRDPGRAMLEGGVLRNWWPRLVDKSIRASLDWHGLAVDLASLVNPDAELSLFSRCHRAEGPCEVFELRSLRPEKTLGKLTVLRRARDAGADSSRSGPLADMLGKDPMRHVALMRNTGQVVKYFPGPLPPEGMEYAGCFVADPAMDRVYAGAEPPTHDNWIPTELDGFPHAKTFVRVTYRRIEETLAEMFRPRGETARGVAGPDLASLADELGELFVGVDGPGKPGPEVGERGGGTGGGRKPSLSISLGQVSRHQRDGGALVSIPVTVKNSEAKRTWIRADANVLVDGGVEDKKKMPVGADAPRVLAWLSPGDGPKREITTDPWIEVEHPGTQEFIVEVWQPADCTVQIDVVESKEAP